MVWYYVLLHEEAHVAYLQRWYKSRYEVVKKMHRTVYESHDKCGEARVRFLLDLFLDLDSMLTWHHGQIHGKNSANTPIPAFGEIPADDLKPLYDGD